jgi:hypothetical protein
MSSTATTTLAHSEPPHQGDQMSLRKKIVPKCSPTHFLNLNFTIIVEKVAQEGGLLL